MRTDTVGMFHGVVHGEERDRGETIDGEEARRLNVEGGAGQVVDMVRLIRSLKSTWLILSKFGRIYRSLSVWNDSPKLK